MPELSLAEKSCVESLYYIASDLLDFVAMPTKALFGEGKKPPNYLVLQNMAIINWKP